MNAQNSFICVARVIAIEPRIARSGSAKLDFTIETPSKEGNAPLRFRAVAYSQLAEDISLAADDWAIFSGRLESGVWGVGKTGIVFMLKDAQKLETPTVA